MGAVRSLRALREPYGARPAPLVAPPSIHGKEDAAAVARQVAKVIGAPGEDAKPALLASHDGEVPGANVMAKERRHDLPNAVKILRVRHGTVFAVQRLVEVTDVPEPFDATPLVHLESLHLAPLGWVWATLV